MAVLESDVDVISAFAQYRLSLIRLAVMLVDDLATAEDVVQDAYVALHRHRGDLREPQALYGYLRRAVVNTAHNVIRRRSLARRSLNHVHPHAGPADEELLLAEEQRAVFAAVRQLPPRQREVVVLRYWSGLSEAEIAEALGISRGAVKSQASRALDKLQAALEGSS
jgi:RNA polymerase sigma-70 factor (sigma-E family)